MTQPRPRPGVPTPPATTGSSGRRYHQYTTIGLAPSRGATVLGSMRPPGVSASLMGRCRYARERWHITGIVKLTEKIALLCSKARTMEDFEFSRAPVFSLFPPPQPSSRGGRLGAIFH